MRVTRGGGAKDVSDVVHRARRIESAAAAETVIREMSRGELDSARGCC